MDVEPPVLAYVGTVPRTFNCRVLPAPNDAEALKLFDKSLFPIDILIIDIRMSPIDGIGLAAQILERQPRIKTLFIAGFAQAPEALQL